MILLGGCAGFCVVRLLHLMHGLKIQAPRVVRVCMYVCLYVFSTHRSVLMTAFKYVKVSRVLDTCTSRGTPTGRQLRRR